MADPIIEDEKNPGGETKNVVVHEDNMIMGIYSLPSQKQIEEYGTFLKNYDAFVEAHLKDGVDYGMIPGVEKPTLLKPGAEKLEKLFFLRSKKECIIREVNADGSFVRYVYRTTVFNKVGQVVGTCEGTCNSKEKKYRSTTVFDNQATPEQKAAGKLEERKSKKGGTYKVYVIEKADVYDLENTIMKMAQKRSYVGAILEATNSSSRFTQDVEDMDIQGDIQLDPDHGKGTPNQQAARESGASNITSLFDKAKANLAKNTNKDELVAYKGKIEKSDKYTAEQKEELYKFIDEVIAKLP